VVLEGKKPNIGFHVGTFKELSKKGEEYYDLGYKTFQVFMGDARSFNLDIGPKDISRVRNLLKKDVRLITHSSYPTSMAKSMSSKIWGSSIEHVIEIARVLNSVGGGKIVTHAGSIEDSYDIENGISNAKFFCEDFEDRAGKYGIELCLENDAGSKKGTRVGNIKNIAEIVKDRQPGVVGTCFDTEHALAYGEDLCDWDYIEGVVNRSSIVHLNAIPSDVRPGSMIDKHSDVLIEHSGVWTGELLNVAQMAVDHDKWCIMEKRGIDLVENDLEFLGRWVIDGSRTRL